MIDFLRDFAAYILLIFSIIFLISAIAFLRSKNSILMNQILNLVIFFVTPTILILLTMLNFSYQNLLKMFLVILLEIITCVIFSNKLTILRKELLKKK
jgi:hypothetical protein